MMRITVVLEYPSEADVPRIGINTTDFGIGKVCAVQFSDALAELEQLHDSAAPQHESQWQPDTSPDLESRDFYEVMQAYRHSLMEKPADVVAAFEAVKAWIRNPTYPYKHPDTIKIPRPEGHDSWSIEIKTSYGGGGGGSCSDTGETTQKEIL